MRIRILLVVALVVALAGGGVFAFSQLAHPTTGFALVDESTLVVLRGRVELQTAGRSDFAQVTNDTPLHVGDRVRTGPDGLAVITYFDGSTTELEPDSAIQLNRLDRLLGGGKTISFSQEAGQSWNRVERLADAQSRFETTTQAATAFVQGTEFQVKVDPITKKMTVDAVTDSVIVQALVNGQIVQVQLDPGFETTVTPDQPPTQPVPSPPAAFALRIDVVGPVAPWMTDSRNRSVGFQPDMDTYASQIPGAHYTAGGGRQSLSLPDPADSYTLVLKAQGDGGPYTVTVTSLVSGQEVAARTFGLAAPLAATSLGGAAQRGQRQQGSLKVNAANRTTTLVGFTPLNGSAPGNGAFATSATGGGAVPPTTTSTATVRPSDTPTAAATADAGSAAPSTAIVAPTEVPPTATVTPVVTGTPPTPATAPTVASPTRLATATVPPTAAPAGSAPAIGPAATEAVPVATEAAPAVAPTDVPPPTNPPAPPTATLASVAPPTDVSAPVTVPTDVPLPVILPTDVPAPTAIPTTPPEPTATRIPTATNAPTAPPTSPPTATTSTCVNPTASASPSRVTPGQGVQFSATGFSAGTSVSLQITGPSPAKSTAVQADSSGRVSIDVQTLPNDQPGQYTISATGTRCGGGSVTVSASYDLLRVQSTSAPATPTHDTFG